jgi:linoleoyl-CoA desaturase
MEMVPTCRYRPAGDDELTAALRRAAAGYFEGAGRSRHGDARAALRVLATLAVCAGSYALLLGPWIPRGVGRLAPAFALGLGLASLGMNVGHDALHGALSRRPWLNALAGLAFDVMGASSYVWRRSHNATHHAFTNVPGLDPDLDFGAALRLAPWSPWRPWHRVQFLYAPFAYALAGIKWHLHTDLALLQQKTLGPFRPQRHRAAALLGVTLTKLSAALWSVVVPWWVLRPTPREFAAGYLTTLLTAGFALGMTFQLAHAVDAVEHPTPDAKGALPGSFMREQLRATMNFACDNPLVAWLCGGLNHQVEHHLFPQVCSVHYPSLRPLVRAVCARHGVRYREAPTLRAAFAAHFRLLRALGRRPAPRHTSLDANPA